MVARSLTSQLDFLVVGAPKAGTTWCQDFFAANSEFFVPEAKETFFFDRHFERGFSWYEGHFAKAEADQFRGEVCHDYMYSNEALDRINDQFDTSLSVIVVLREPVARSTSHLRYSHQLGNVKTLDTAALEVNPKIVELSRYDQYLPAIIERFGDRLSVLFFEHLRADASAFARSLTTAASGRKSSGDLLVIPERSNPSGRARSASLVRAGVRSAQVLDRVGARDVLGRIKRSPLRRALFDTTSRLNPRPEVLDFFEGELADSRTRTLDQLRGAGLVTTAHIPTEWLK